MGANLTVDRVVRIGKLVPGSVLRADHVRTAPGGKAVNVARAAAGLGGSCVLVGNLPGRGGREAAEELVAARLDVVPVHTAGELRAATITVETSGRTTVINEPGPPLSPTDAAAFLAAVKAALARHRPRVVVASGSLPPEAPINLYAIVVALAHGTGATAIVDSGGAALAGAIEAGADVVKPNLAEAEAVLRGGPAAAPELLDDTGADVAARCVSAATSLVSAGAGAALVSGGRHGVALRADGRSWWYAAPAVRTVNPVGAGDALVAGLSVALERGEPLVEAVRGAVAVAAESVTHAGPAEVQAQAVRRILADLPAAELVG